MLASTVCYGAASEDLSVYVRKDVFEAHMRRIDDKLDMILETQKEMQEELKAQRRDLNEVARTISILSTRVDGIEARMGDMRYNIYPAVQKMLQNRASHQPSITLEDVRRLIQEELRKTAPV